MVQLSVFQQIFYGKGAPRWYNEISKKNSTLRSLVKSQDLTVIAVFPITSGLTVTSGYTARF